MSMMQNILAEVQSVISKIDQDQLQQVAAVLAKGKRIFVIGEGRSGLMAKSFAMRLMHLGATVYVVGETITPSIADGDIMVSVSGSGTTKSVVWTAEKAKSMGCFVVALTTDLASPLAGCASLSILIPAATKYRRDHEAVSIQPLGSLFDQCAHIIFDTMCLYYAAEKKTDHETAFNQHSNLE